MKERNQTIDIARGLCMLLMIYDHVAQSGRLITSFHMPLFFLVSGYFFREMRISDLLLRRGKTLLLPYLTYGLLAAVIMAFLGDNFWSRIIGLLTGQDCWLLYFLLVMFEATVIYNLLYKISRRNYYLLAILAILLAAIGYGLSLYFGRSFPYYLDVALIAVFFLFMGDLASRVQIANWSMSLQLVVLLVALMLWGLGLHQGMLVLALRIYQPFPLCILAACGGGYVVIQFCRILGLIPGLKKYLAFVGQYSLEFLCLANIMRQAWPYNPGISSPDALILCNRGILQTAFLQILICSIILFIWIGWKKKYGMHR